MERVESQWMPGSPWTDRQPVYGDWHPTVGAARHVLAQYAPSIDEAHDLLQRALDNWDAFHFLMDVLGAQLDEHFTAWQVNKMFLMCDAGVAECLDSRNRGGSKTRDGSIACILIAGAEPGTDAMWLSGNTMQLDQALQYVNRLEDRTFLGRIFHVKTNKTTKMNEAQFLNQSRIVYNASTATSGPRTNLLWFDEEGKITEKNKVENNRNAYGMVTSSKGNRRIRHTTTLAIGTPAQEVYKQLKPEQLVFINYPEDCDWWTEDDWALLNNYKRTKPRWWINCEYYSILDAQGGRIFTQQHDLSIFPLRVPTPLLLRPGVSLAFRDPVSGEDKVITIDNHWRAYAGTDWNSSWGHTVAVVITNRENWFVVDEFRGTSLTNMAVFLLRWQNHDFWGNTFEYTAERQGGGKSMQSRKETLEKQGVRVTNEEPFTPNVQITKLSYLEYLNEHGNLHFADYCKATIDQADTYRRDPATGLPASGQEDHLLDGLIHAVPSPAQAVQVQTEGMKW